MACLCGQRLRQCRCKNNAPPEVWQLAINLAPPPLLVSPWLTVCFSSSRRDSKSNLRPQRLPLLQGLLNLSTDLISPIQLPLAIRLSARVAGHELLITGKNCGDAARPCEGGRESEREWVCVRASCGWCGKATQGYVRDAVHDFIQLPAQRHPSLAKEMANPKEWDRQSTVHSRKVV